MRNKQIGWTLDPSSYRLSVTYIHDTVRTHVINLLFTTVSEGVTIRLLSDYTTMIKTVLCTVVSLGQLKRLHGK